MLARGFSPVSDLSASANGARESRECRRITLLDGGCSDDVGDRSCFFFFCAPRAGFGLSVAIESRETTSPPSTVSPITLFAGPVCPFSSATDDMDDCERRGLAPALGAEEDEDVVVVVDETEIEAA